MHQILFDNWKLALLAKIFYKHKKKTESIGIIEIKSREKWQSFSPENILLDTLIPIMD